MLQTMREPTRRRFRLAMTFTGLGLVLAVTVFGLLGNRLSNTLPRPLGLERNAPASTGSLSTASDATRWSVAYLLSDRIEQVRRGHEQLIENLRRAQLDGTRQCDRQATDLARALSTTADSFSSAGKVAAADIVTQLLCLPLSSRCDRKITGWCEYVLECSQQRSWKDEPQYIASETRTGNSRLNTESEQSWALNEQRFALPGGDLPWR